MEALEMERNALANEHEKLASMLSQTQVLTIALQYMPCIPHSVLQRALSWHEHARGYTLASITSNPYILSISLQGQAEDMASRHAKEKAELEAALQQARQKLSDAKQV